MDIKKFATWEYLIFGGLCLWILVWLVTFIAVVVKLVAGIMVAAGVIDLVFSLINKNKSDDVSKQPKKENEESKTV